MAKILLIDDDPLVISYLDRLLQTTEHTVVGITNGLDAVTRFESLRPDLVIVDIWMPIQDGFETMRALRKIDPNAKVITCSGHPSYWGKRVTDVAAERGATAFLQKPFVPQAFLDLVAEVLNAPDAKPLGILCNAGQPEEILVQPSQASAAPSGAVISHAGE
jgi:two-component system chemotaxis response regulator CheY